MLSVSFTSSGDVYGVSGALEQDRSVQQVHSGVYPFNETPASAAVKTHPFLRPTRDTWCLVFGEVVIFFSVSWN